MESKNDSAKQELKVLQDLLKYGDKAKEKIYFGLLKKINNGEALSASETRTFEKIGKELEAARDEIEILAQQRFKYQAAADYLGISKRTLSYHIGKGRIRQEANGDFLREELDRFKRKQGYEISADDEDISTLKAKADLQLKKYRAKREECLLKQLMGELISIEDVHREWVGRIKEITTSLRAWGNTLPPLLDGKTKHEMKAIINKEVHDLLMRYARTGRWTPDVRETLEEIMNTPSDGQQQSV